MTRIHHFFLARVGKITLRMIYIYDGCVTARKFLDAYNTSFCALCDWCSSFCEIDGSRVKIELGLRMFSSSLNPVGRF